MQRPKTSVSSIAILLMAFFACVGETSAQAAGWPEVGSKAPDFELPIQGEDGYLSLSELVKDGPVVVVVLRGFPGYQCGVCKRQLGSLINRAKGISNLTGGKPRRVVLVYPGPGEMLDKKAEQFMGSRKLPELMVVVRDPDMEMISEWGLRWKAPSETAYPSTFVIDGARRVVWSKVSESHAGRSTPDEILKALKSI